MKSGSFGFGILGGEQRPHVPRPIVYNLSMSFSNNAPKSKTRAILELFANAVIPDNAQPSMGRNYRFNRQSTYSLLNRLKRQGHVRKVPQEGKSWSSWTITASGLKKLKCLKEKTLPSISNNRGLLEKRGLNLVIFDIPEKLRNKRKWLRNLLVSLEYLMLQKSVWLGFRLPSPKFYKYLKETSLGEFVKVIKIDPSLRGKISNIIERTTFLIFGASAVYLSLARELV
ncbi:MAG: hypothetical protein M1153_00685 [Patescibacteria group bacterium]|nr:hypothetical protein [Patescibacteria group bacterium]